MRVLYLEASTGGVVGGSLTGLFHLLQGLDRQRYEPIVVLYETKTIQPELNRAGIRVLVFHKPKRGRTHPLQKIKGYQRLRSRRILGRFLHQVRELRLFVQETLPATCSLLRLFRKEKPNIIHLCNGFRSNLDAIIAARLAGVPCICHVKAFEKYGWTDRLFARWADLGICMTRAVKEHCQSYGVSAKRMTVIYDGLDVDGFRPARDSSATRKEVGIPLDVPVVGVVGNIQGWKGQAVVVEAIQEVRRILPDVRCLIVGGVHRNGAHYFQQIQRFIKEHRLEQHVICTGARNDVADLVGAMDILIHASVAPEPFGRVILEGMALGKPVIATNLGGVPEFVQDGVTGRLVPPNDHHALARTIVELLGDAAHREHLGNNARREVRGCFMIQRHVKEVTHAYANFNFGASAPFADSLLPPAR